ncbi:MAG: M13 family metallopeptidase [Planctomycetes bacterium]|nr:M13 family metallopeptidase [Planctomycetota bacterium]
MNLVLLCARALRERSTVRALRAPTAAALLLAAACGGPARKDGEAYFVTRTPAPSASTATAAPTAAAAASPEAHGLDLATLDRSADPARDFYRFANGGWLDRNPVPADEAQWGVFHEVDQRNLAVLRALLEKSAQAPQDELHRKLGDFYASGMDEAAIDAAGAAPLAEPLAAIAALEHVSALPRLLAELHRIGVSALFGVGSGPDLSDTSMNILWIAQDGMGLPERDYYKRDDAASVALREQYVGHVARMVTALGVPAEQASLEAATILALEGELAAAGYGALDFRDPQKLLNKVGFEALQKATPHFDWGEYLDALELDGSVTINLIAPGYFAALDALLARVPLADLKSYLRWQLVHAQADYLGQAFAGEHFAFFGRALGGAQEQRPRWKRVIDAVGGSMGEALGQAFVGETFSPRAKERCQKMVDDLLAAFRERLAQLPWMSEETRAKALAKLAQFKTKIGYPDTWRDWSGLAIARDSYARNRQRAAAFEKARDLGKVGKPVDRAEFGMPAYLVNAGYNPTNNDITFPAGILQPPFFSETYDDALNYGAMGAVIGHEITHGFDDQGSQFDGAGNLANWWGDADRAEFERRAQVVVAQFDGYRAIDDLHVNGKLTLGENIADLGGVTIAYAALQRALAGKERPLIDGFTPEQRFFLAWARAWRSNETPAQQRLQVNTNPHSPARFRVVGPLSNVDEFAAAFALPPDAPMMRPPEQRARIW